MRGEITLEDVARESGVSRAAASRALNNREGVRDEVRDRIRLTAEELGYRPNRAAQNLASGRASVIGLVLGERDMRARPYATALTQAVATSAESHDQALILVLGANDPNETVRNSVGNGLVDGVIVSYVAADSPWVAQLIEDRMPMVFIGGSGAPFDVPTVNVENRDSSAELVGHLLDTGSSRVATITGPPNRPDAARRLEGYRLAHQQRSLPVDESLIFVGDFTRTTGYELASQVFDRGADAVFCANDGMARGFYHRAMERGVKVPDEFGLVGFDGTSVDPFDLPSLTSMIQPFDAMADAALEMLIRRVGGAVDVKSRTLAPRLFHGSTARPPL